MSDVSENPAELPVPPPVAPTPAETLKLSAPTAPRQVISPATQVRIWCSFVGALCLGMLAIGLWLSPDPNGTGTHQQLGLAPCGWYLTWGFPCMTCGCTTAVSHFSHGHLIASFITQPFGFVVALVALILVPLTAIGVATGKWRGPSMFTLNWYWQYWLFGTLGVLLASWIYKIIAVKHGIA